MLMPKVFEWLVCSEGKQGAGKSSSAGIGNVLTEKSKGSAAETTHPDSDPLQGIADKTVADGMDDLVSENVPGNVAAEGRLVAPAQVREAEDEQVSP